MQAIKLIETQLQQVSQKKLPFRKLAEVEFSVKLSLFGAVIATPVRGACSGEARFDADFLINFENNVLRSVTTTLTFFTRSSVPVSTSLTVFSNSLCIHNLRIINSLITFEQLKM